VRLPCLHYFDRFASGSPSVNVYVVPAARLCHSCVLLLPGQRTVTRSALAAVPRPKNGERSLELR